MRIYLEWMPAIIYYSGIWLLALVYRNGIIIIVWLFFLSLFSITHSLFPSSTHESILCFPPLKGGINTSVLYPPPCDPNFRIAGHSQLG